MRCICPQRTVSAFQICVYRKCLSIISHDKLIRFWLFLKTLRLIFAVNFIPIPFEFLLITVSDEDHFNWNRIVVCLNFCCHWWACIPWLKRKVDWYIRISLGLRFAFDSKPRIWAWIFILQSDLFPCWEYRQNWLIY